MTTTAALPSNPIRGTRGLTLLAGLALLAMTPHAARATSVAIPGTDIFGATASMQITLNNQTSTPGTYMVTLSGSVSVQRAAESAGVIDTEIVALSLTGTEATLGNVTVGLGDPASLGEINNLTLSGQELVSGDSFFDVYFTIDLTGPGVTLQNPTSNLGIMPTSQIADLQDVGSTAGPLPLNGGNQWSLANTPGLWDDVDVQPDGNILFAWVVSSGSLDSFVLTSVPEPSRTVLAAISLLMVAGGFPRRRRARS